jgi:hypothetical protein
VVISAKFSHVSQGLFRNPLWRDPRASFGAFLSSIGNHFLHRFLSISACRTNKALPALESDPIRFGESFDVLPFTVHKRREADAWKSELAHEFGEVKNRRLANRDLFSRFDVVGLDGLPVGLLSSDAAVFTAGLLSSETVPFHQLAVLGHGSLFLLRFAVLWA